MNDEELEQIFKQNKPDIPVEASFQREVWQKIESGDEQASLASLCRSAVGFLMRPTIGIPLSAVLIAFSAWLAVLNGVESSNATWSELSFSYNQLINPITHYK